MWFTKSRRAQNDEDYETWIEGGVAPTLNAFDNGDIRATTVILVRMREGKPGGGKGPLMSENRSLTLATNNDQTMFIFYGNRVGDIRMQNDRINTLQARMGTGGNNMPMVATVFSHTQGLDPQASEEASPTLRANGNGMAVAYPISGNVVGRQDHNGPNGKSFGEEDDPMFTLTSTDRHAVATSQVRRLTPMECERLQGFPDGWTEGQSDSTRYKQMGNAVAVPVVNWIIEGIVDTL